MYSQFFPATKNFDKLLENLASEAFKQTESYPPYNIATIEEDDKKYGIISMAVTGLSEDDLKVYFDRDGYLTIEGQYPESKNIVYHHKGLSTKDFTRKFKLIRDYKVDEVTVENGLLNIKLLEDQPEVSYIPINKHKAIEQNVA